MLKKTPRAYTASLLMGASISLVSLAGVSAQNLNCVINPNASGCGQAAKPIETTPQAEPTRPTPPPIPQPPAPPAPNATSDGANQNQANQNQASNQQTPQPAARPAPRPAPQPTTRTPAADAASPQPQARERVQHTPLVSGANRFPRPEAADQSLVRAVRISQSEIESGQRSFREIQEIGRHLFTQPFTKIDGYGEGPDGGRSIKMQQLRHTPGSAFEFFPDVPWMRIHGLDSQNCLECHNLNGVAQLADTDSDALSARPDRVAGSGGLSANAMINPLLQEPAPEWLLQEMRNQGLDDNHQAAFLFLRNPPHVMGTGYTQKLAQEMSIDLLFARELTLEAARQSPGQWFEIPLESKGTNFGTYAALYRAGAPTDVTGVCGDLPGFEEDCSAIEGVSHDFVVRPFQWKGIASNMRNFVRDALNFHFGVQPVETTPGRSDADGDGVHDEISIGEVTALTLFALSNRPPLIAEPASSTEAALMARGQQIFEQDADCASCHTPSLPLYDPWVSIHDPSEFTQELANLKESAVSLPVTVDAGIGLGVATPKDRPLPIDALFAATKARQANKQASDRKESLSTAVRETIGAYAFNLNMDTGPEQDALPASFPRLKPGYDAVISVPLFSDLKRHRMGPCLADPVAQQVDREGIVVERDLYLTRPLWGLANSAPYMHDARALTLEDAILAHGDQACQPHYLNDGLPPSEANASVQAFLALSAQDQAALITYLKAFRIPLEPSLAGSVQ